MGAFTGTALANGNGVVYVDNAASWAAVKVLGTGSAIPNADPSNAYASQLGTPALGSRSIGRVYIPFDTSSIGISNRATAGTLSINIQQIFGANGTVHLVKSNQASGGTVVSADFGSPTFVSGGSTAVSSTGIKTIVLNATALGWITSTGTSLLGLVDDHDLTNTDPGATDNRFAISMPSNGTAADRPTLNLLTATTGQFMTTNKYW